MTIIQTRFDTTTGAAGDALNTTNAATPTPPNTVNKGATSTITLSATDVPGTSGVMCSKYVCAANETNFTNYVITGTGPISVRTWFNAAAAPTATNDYIGQFRNSTTTVLSWGCTSGNFFRTLNSDGSVQVIGTVTIPWAWTTKIKVLVGAQKGATATTGSWYLSWYIGSTLQETLQNVGGAKTGTTDVTAYRAGRGTSVAGTWTFQLDDIAIDNASYGPTDPLDLTADIGESIGISDARTWVAARVALVADSLGLSDAPSLIQGKTISVADGLGIDDTGAPQQVDVGLALSDSAAITDAVVTTESMFVTPADTIGAVDALVVDVGRAAALTDTAGITDAIGTIMARQVTVTDGLTIDELIDPTTDVGRVIAVGDTVGVTDAASTASDIAKTAAAADTLGITDAPGTVSARVVTLAETIGLVDATSLVLDRPVFVADSLGVIDAVTTSLGSPQGAADGMSIADTPLTVMDRIITLSETIGVSDAAIGGAGRPAGLADTAGITDATTAVMAKFAVISETIGVSDATSTLGVLAADVGELVGITEELDILMERDLQVTLSETIGVTDTAGTATTVAKFGAAAGTFTITGTATGLKPDPSGTANGTVGWGGTANSVIGRTGAAVGGYTFGGNAAGGRASVANTSGAFTFGGSAFGQRILVVGATGTISWAGGAVGSRSPVGIASGQFIFSGSGGGDRIAYGEVYGHLQWAGTALGRVGGVVDPLPPIDVGWPWPGDDRQAACDGIVKLPNEDRIIIRWPVRSVRTSDIAEASLDDGDWIPLITGTGEIQGTFAGAGFTSPGAAVVVTKTAHVEIRITTPYEVTTQDGGYIQLVR